MQIPEIRNGPGWAIMRHPGVPDSYSEVTEAAYHAAWEPKGWVLITDQDRARSFEGVRKPDLITEANRLGLDPTGTADELRERLAGHQAEGSA